MTALITQSNYIPWKGYFDAIAKADYFIIYDTVQYTKRDWRNRNVIKTTNGLQWLTIPVEVKGKYLQKINEVKIADVDWNEKHWGVLKQVYKNAPEYKNVSGWLEGVYTNCRFELLTETNEYLLKEIAGFLGITTKSLRAEQFELQGDRNERLLSVCKNLGVSEYLSGPAAKSYLNVSLFEQNNIKVTFLDYSGYESYIQTGSNFNHNVSIVDMLFNLGAQTSNYLKFVK